MARPITLVTGQWGDMPLEELAQKTGSWGYDGLELCPAGDHLDPNKAATDKKYCDQLLKTLEKNNLKVFAISGHMLVIGRKSHSL